MVKLTLSLSLSLSYINGHMDGEMSEEGVLLQYSEFLITPTPPVRGETGGETGHRMLSKNKRLRGNGKGNTAMAESPVRKRSLKLRLFASGATDPLAAAVRSPRSPRSFDDGVVGLGIVAAMSGSGDGQPQMEMPAARSEPIPIVSPRPRAAPPRAAAEEEEDDELSESYTCVISYVGGGPARKRVYFDDGSDVIGGGDGGGCGVFYQSPAAAAEGFLVPPPPPEADFLSRCYLCKKKLHGLDIFMYRGEKAFCSVECRCQQILNDEYREKCGSGALKSFEYSVSPCSTPLFFAARVAAA